MPERDTHPPGAPCWIDLATSDPDRAKEFYGQLLGWTAETAGEEYGGYISFLRNGRMVAGGIGNTEDSGFPDMWTIYLRTEDAQATADAAAAHGGQVLVPPMVVSEMGSMAVLSDPGQAALGLWQPGTHRGFGLVGESGAPVWFELHTRDYEAAVDFYRDVFAWDAHVMSDSPEFRYTTLGEGDDALAGIMDATTVLPEGAPSTWRVYFGVDDADDAVRRAVDMGGSVLREPEDSPYGRLADLADPTGAPFMIAQMDS